MKWKDNVSWFITLNLNTTCALFEEILFFRVTNVPSNLYWIKIDLQIS